MSATRRSNQCDNDRIHSINAPRHDHSATEVIDPESLPGIEMNAARDLIAGQKLVDPYLVCFDEPYDAEKYAIYWT
jgi:hypothetical protein